MDGGFPRRFIFVALLGLLMLAPPCLGAALPAGYTVTYTITIQGDGSAAWQVEYRTPLVTQDELSLFENSSTGLRTILDSPFKDLMEQSAAQASIATSRPMEITNFTNDSFVQTSPSGRYGVILYSFIWTGFARAESDLIAGDAFIGGMYLDKGTTLILKYPPEYTVISVDPPPDQVSSGLIWYGLRSFGGGEPRVVLQRSGVPWIPLLGGVMILVFISGGYLLVRRRGQQPAGDEVPQATIPLSQGELLSLEDRIIALLTANPEGVFQSEIGKRLDVPKSTLSSTLNDLHMRGLIQKVKKGKENLIRMKRGEGQ
jgi:hypothetical protein